MKLLLSFILCFVFLKNFPTESAKLKSIQWPPKGPEMVFEDEDNDNIRGMGGKDYPIYGSIPRTSFSCNKQIPGFYADIETNCQVFHLCFDNQKTSFLCNNGTIFNQKLFTCNWWYNTTCSDSTKYYSLNLELYKVPVKAKSIENVEEKLMENIKKTENKNPKTTFQTQKLERLPVLAQLMTNNKQELPRNKNAGFKRSEAINNANIRHPSKAILENSRPNQDDEQNSESINAEDFKTSDE